MRQAWMEDRSPRMLGALVDLALHGLVMLLVLVEVSARSGSEAVIVAGLLFPITYLLGPLALGIAAGLWLPFALQLVAAVGAVALLGLPTLDPERADRRSCFQLLASTLLVVILDLVLHVGALAIVIERIHREWGLEAGIAATVAFPVTYLVGPVALAFTGTDWVPLVLQVAAFGLVGFLIVISDA